MSHHARPAPVSWAVTVMSFGYRHGPPPVADITIDVRAHLRNPSADPRFRDWTGQAPAVRDHVLTTPGAAELVEGVVATATALLPGARAAGRPVRVAIGCAGGRHRSVALAEAISDQLTAALWTVTVAHLHVHEPVVTQTPA